MHTDIKPENYKLSLKYSEMANMQSEEFDRHHNMVLFRSKEIQRKMKIKIVKQSIEHSTKKLSKKERKKLKKKMKKMEKKMLKSANQHVEMMKE
jgi:small nuclear ribonucleoprotein (snRNP)-like protein